MVKELWLELNKMFKVIKTSKKNQARLCEISTPHGKIRSPFFMPIATRGAVKNLTVDELNDLGSQIVLSNTYHLLIRPGMKIMKKVGGLHKFMNWSKPILTDSGGFQVFSLAKHRKITKNGVHFSDPQSGEKYFITPKKAIQIQQTIGSDIMMAFDECPKYPCTKKYAKESLELTTKWAQLCKDQKLKSKNKQLLFGIVQGSIYKDLRIESAKQLAKIGFDGYAIGGIAVGEPRKYMEQILKWTIPELPQKKARYLMGVGKPEEIIQAVKNGVDMFDCVIPTREARHGRLYVWTGRSEPQLTSESKQRLRLTQRAWNFYKTINITNAKFVNDLTPINQTNLKPYSKAYLHHLFRTNEPLGMRLATLNNLNFYLMLMSKIRELIRVGDI
ncbi:tRNA guanosine(34) transglycosylase Tgt [Patescibacteria group bacterium]|nr:tRNA guanosine(34) transglycosylase Tgt [Patescibacteria group bacterium]